MNRPNPSAPRSADVIHVILTLAARSRAISRSRAIPGLVLLVAVTVLCLSTPAHAQTREERFQKELDELRGEHGFPGATAAFILPDGTGGRAATGFSDLESQVPMRPESRMLAASIGKSFVAATAMALAREGALDLDDSVAEWLGDRPWFSHLPNQATLTVDQLLRHTGGLPDHVYSEAFAGAWKKGWREGGPPLSAEGLVALILDRPPLFDAGEGWAYTDTGYILLGMIIERASGEGLYQQISDRFLWPLRLGLTTPSDQRILPGLAAGYTAADNPFGLPPKTTVAPGVMAWNPGVEWAGGGLASNPRDLVSWAQALYQGRILGEDSMEELLRSVPVDPDSPDIRYGAGVAIHEAGSLGPTWGHAGRIPGYTSSVRYYPDHGMAVAFQINTDGGFGEVSPNMDFIPEMEIRLAETILEVWAGS